MEEDTVSHITCGTERIDIKEQDCARKRDRRKHWNVNVTSQATDKKPARASSDSCQGAKDEKESVQEARDTEKVIK